MLRQNHEWASFIYESKDLRSLSPEAILALETERMLGDLPDDNSVLNFFREQIPTKLAGYRAEAKRLLKLPDTQIENLVSLDMARIMPVWMACLRVADFCGFNNESVPLATDYYDHQKQYLRLGIERMAELFPSFVLNRENILSVEEFGHCTWGDVKVWADNDKDFRTRVVQNARNEGLSEGIFNLMTVATNDERFGTMMQISHQELFGASIPAKLRTFLARTAGIIIAPGGEMDVILDQLTHEPYLLVPVEMWKKGDFLGSRLLWFFSCLVYLEAKYSVMRQNELFMMMPANHILEMYAANEALEYVSESKHVRGLNSAMRIVDGSEAYDWWRMMVGSYSNLASLGFLEHGMPVISALWGSFEKESIPERRVGAMLTAWSDLVAPMIKVRGLNLDYFRP